MTETPELIEATDRAEDECCQKLTQGCCVDHSNGYETCETW